MKLGEPRSPKRRLRSSEVLLPQEKGETTAYKKLALRAVELIGTYPEKVWIHKLEPGKFLASFAFPDLAPKLFKDPNQEIVTLRDFLAKEKKRGSFPDDAHLMRLATLKILGAPYQVTAPSPEKIMSSLSSKEVMGSNSQKDVVRQAALLSWLFPELKEAISATARICEEEVYKNVDQELLDPNRESPSTGAYFRLIHPGGTVTLQEIANRQKAAWEEQTEEELSPQKISKYTNRGFNFSTNRALLATAGLEILLAQEAAISPQGELRLLSASTALEQISALPERNLAS